MTISTIFIFCGLVIISLPVIPVSSDSEMLKYASKRLRWISKTCRMAPKNLLLLPTLPPNHLHPLANFHRFLPQAHNHLTDATFIQTTHHTESRCCPDTAIAGKDALIAKLMAQLGGDKA